MSTSRGLTSEDVTVMDHLDHILQRPDTYVGSIEEKEVRTWVASIDADNKVSLAFREIRKPFGAYQLFDELIVNALDATINDPTVRTIRICADKDNGVIQVFNNGVGIDTSLHKETGLRVPEVIFGRLLSGTNLVSNEKNKFTGGRNGLGAKLANVYSEEFTVSITDCMGLSHPGKVVTYEQKWTNNMKRCGRAKVEVQPMESDSEGQVCVTFKPIKQLLPSGITDDFIKLMRRRALDIAACTPREVTVIFNGVKLEVSDFAEYVNMFVGEPTSRVRFQNAHFDVIISRNPSSLGKSMSIDEGHGNSHQFVSFVNGISTDKGGDHVSRFTNQIESFVSKKIREKIKNPSYRFGYHTIMDYFCIFVNAKIENPSFSSQTKDEMTKSWVDFYKESQLSEEFLKKMADHLDFMDDLVEKSSHQSALKSAKKFSKIGKGRPDIDKLEDANKAGVRGQHNVLILTEGDSAKTFAVTGLEKTGRDNFGVFPLKGKPLNVTSATEVDINKNEEYCKIKTIVGLDDSKTYTPEDVKKLRYQEIWIISDADPDGIHIRGLCMQMFRCRFPSLLTNVKGFLKIFITPQIIAKNKRERLYFYSHKEFEDWHASPESNARKYNILYLKGLGSISREDALRFFSDIPKHVKTMRFDKTEDFDALDMAFDQERVEQRRQWNNHYVSLGKSAPTLDYNKKGFRAAEFVSKELVQYSLYTNANKLPHLMDGLKPCTRKIMQYFLEHPAEMKVNNATGLISARFNYHHGEKSMHDAIVGMNQFFVGSNQIPYLKAEGQFGSRLMGGADASSPRYISTSLGDYMNLIFLKEDFPVLEDCIEDGEKCEKHFLAPIIPTCMVNGSFGIGMGWMGGIHGRNIRMVIDNVKDRLNGQETSEPSVDFLGFSGTFSKEGEVSYGKYTFSQDRTCIKVTELPLKVWTCKFSENLKCYMKGYKGSQASATGKRKRGKKVPEVATTKKREQSFQILDVHNNSSDKKVDFEIQFEDPIPEEGQHDMEKKLLLQKSLSKMTLTFITPSGEIQTFSDVKEIMDVFYSTRLETYALRKQHMLDKMKTDMEVMENKMNFIDEVINGTIVIKSKTVGELTSQLREKGYSDQSGFDYLLGMRQDAITKDQVTSLRERLGGLKKEIEDLSVLSPEDLWMRDLAKLESKLVKDRII